LVSADKRPSVGLGKIGEPLDDIEGRAVGFNAGLHILLLGFWLFQAIGDGMRRILKDAVQLNQLIVVTVEIAFIN
jgi:hypothetical protein